MFTPMFTPFLFFCIFDMELKMDYLWHLSLLFYGLTKLTKKD